MNAPEPDYQRLLRLHAAFWTMVFMMLAGGWVMAVVASLGFGNAVPALLATALWVAAVAVCRIRYMQLRDAEDEALIRALQASLEDL